MAKLTGKISGFPPRIVTIRPYDMLYSKLQHSSSLSTVTGASSADMIQPNAMGMLEKLPPYVSPTPPRSPHPAGRLASDWFGPLHPHSPGGGPISFSLACVYDTTLMTVHERIARDRSDSPVASLVHREPDRPPESPHWQAPKRFGSSSPGNRQAG